jgi:sodium/potassium-transporting ATPase subunit alpha
LKGLTESKAAELLMENGRNEIAPPKKRHPFLIFLDMFKNPLTALLLMCGVLSIIIYGIDSSDPNNVSGLSFCEIAL